MGGGGKLQWFYQLAVHCGAFSRYLLDQLSPHFSPRWGGGDVVTNDFGLMHQLMLVASAFVYESVI